MKTISVSVLESDYEALRKAAKKEGRSIAQLIREAMALYRQERLEAAPRLHDVPVIPGPRPRGPLPDRQEIFEEIFGDELP